MDFEIEKDADVQEREPVFETGEQWSIEEDAPRWPDGRRMYREDEAELVNCVREAFAQSATPSVFELREQMDLSNSLVDALVKSRVEKTIHNASFEHFSLVFLAGVAWAKRRSTAAQ